MPEIQNEMTYLIAKSTLRLIHRRLRALASGKQRKPTGQNIDSVVWLLSMAERYILEIRDYERRTGFSTRKTGQRKAIRWGIRRGSR